MPPQIKQDLNRSGWESTDFPSVCETCLPDNPYVKMLKEDYGAECKLCTRPFTVFSWSADRSHGRKKRTNICLTCARLKNCCQTCMLDLSFGLPVAIRDAALKMVAPGPGSEVNREYFAQNMEKEIEEGRGGTEEYEKTDEKARELLRRLATSKPYFRKGRAIEDGSAASGAGPRPGGNRRPFPAASQLPPGPQDYLPPKDKNIMSIFITGVEDDLPEYKIRDFFKEHGKIKSLVCSHMSHCAFINYETREAAERAAEACQGRAVIAGCPLRVRWSVPKAVGTMTKEQRAEMGRDGRSAFGDVRKQKALEGRPGQRMLPQGDGSEQPGQPDSLAVVAAPPGASDVNYASLAGD
ncbi:pre-mRNA-splicing factor slt-11 [Truncatella angustata]|uniref:Pre-mRNA-splicing factor slt-11 n=1 Tax=Truncatella angustata TaxID=152316 RepID=A0A9P8UFY9_9PEZI|nr:pre-mRNA-splicing factor slt-11 [Truncatella angustata]KAH6651504.1 pre-mRNA-splicing factor slt-11 [Truncatella angustata]